tara:strand:- start:464 stop:697 length:234 start_codon:yes stop_codon:yes gene_type:complete
MEDTMSIGSELGKDELSKEELVERRKKITDYYSDHIPHLKVQLEYETLLTEIEENRAKRVQAQKFIAQAMAPKDGDK